MNEEIVTTTRPAKRKKSRPYTVEDVRYVVENYSRKTAAEIAAEIGISKFQVSKIASELRRQNVDLPRKNVKRPNPIMAFIHEEGLKPSKSEPKQPAKRRGGGRAAKKK